MGKPVRHIVISDLTQPSPLFVIDDDDPDQLAEAMIAIVSGIKDGDYRSIMICAVKSTEKVGP